MTAWKATPRWLLALTAVAVAVGVLARFKGLGASAFSVDEYYLARSIEDVLRTGFPVFDCGGYYLRGLLQQYASAGLQIGGLAPELAPRVIAALCGLASLPAAYLLGRRVSGPAVGLLLVTVLALSVWEVEMSRFGRMYAPFQALFLWYSLFFIRVTVDRDERAVWKMLLLSVIAPFVWEGAALVALANLLALFMLRPAGRLAWRDAPALLAGIGLLVASYLLVAVDARNINGDEFPQGFEATQGMALAGSAAVVQLPLTVLNSHPGWLLAFLLPLIFLGWALKWVWSFRQRPLLALALLAGLFAALAHQFLLVAALVILLLLMRYIRWNEVSHRSALPYYLAVGLSLLFWTAYALAALYSSHATSVSARDLALLMYQLMAFPDFLGNVLRPFSHVMPIWGGFVLLLVGAAVWRNSRNQDVLTAERALLVLLIVLVLAACSAGQQRIETRYFYFAYPLAVLVALSSLEILVRRLLPREPAVAMATGVIALGSFVSTEDFQPTHLRSIDAPYILYRTGMSVDKQGHYEIREDLHSLAAWLRANASPGTVFINGVHGLDVYFLQFGYYHVDQANPGMMEWSCKRGSIERWGNYPLLHSTEALADIARRAPRTLLVTFNYDEPALMQQLALARPSVVRRQGHLIVLELGG